MNSVIRRHIVFCSVASRSFSHATESAFKKLYTGKDGTDYIAYRKLEPSNPSRDIGIMFCQGFLSNMNGRKSLFLEDYCTRRQLNYVTFDYLGHGSSTGKFEDFTIGLWKQNTLEILDKVAEGPQIMVGSSIGSWIMLLVANANPIKVHGMVGLASAPDLLFHKYERLGNKEKNELKQRGYFNVPEEISEQLLKFPFDVIIDAEQNQVLKKEICYDGPVHLLHGMNDATVPFEYSMTISDKLRTKNVSVHLLKDGDHSLSRDSDLKFLSCILDQLIFN